VLTALLKVDERSYLSSAVFEMSRDLLSVFFDPSSNAASDRLTREQHAVLATIGHSGYRQKMLLANPLIETWH